MKIYVRRSAFGILVLGILIVLFGQCREPSHKTYKLLSPNKNIRLRLKLNKKEQPEYAIDLQGKKVIAFSPLGIKLKKEGAISDNLSLYKTESRRYNQTYTSPIGKNRSIQNHFREKIFYLKEMVTPFRKIQLIFRAYNDGVAFRYKIPKQEAIDTIQVLAEETHFRFSKNPTCWPLQLNGYQTNQEGNYNKQPLNRIVTKDLNVIGLPLTFRINKKVSGSIAEAHLKDYAGLYLRKPKKDSLTLKSQLAPHLKHHPAKVVRDSSLTTPWRVIMLANNAHKLIASNLIMNLNPPSSIKDTSWIKPGKAAWDWWSGPVVNKWNIEAGMNNATMKYYIDFAAAMNLEYMLIDAGWYGDHKDPEKDITTSVPEIDIPMLVDYAAQKNVEIALWVNWKNLNRQMEEALALYEKWGVKGIKVDYMNADDQQMVDFYHRLLQKAAQHHLIVNLHGAYKPTGLRRTYPNLLTREGIMGAEHNKYSDKVSPEHNVTIPFTRMLVGPMDYTPGGFDNVTPQNFTHRYKNPMVMGTRCHQLAMYVVYESPLQMVSDHPSAYRNETGGEFLKHVPASWDQTIPIDGKIGDYVILARQHNKEWYVGAMTDSTARRFEVSLSFLDTNTTYRASIYRDHQKSHRYPKWAQKVSKTVRSTDTLTVRMVEGGGYAARIEKQ